MPSIDMMDITERKGKTQGEIDTEKRCRKLSGNGRFEFFDRTGCTWLIWNDICRRLKVGTKKGIVFIPENLYNPFETDYQIEWLEES
ncbi:hypothetical protein ACFLU6_01420 [Acidobacteriota bacterium]